MSACSTARRLGAGRLPAAARRSRPRRRTRRLLQCGVILTASRRHRLAASSSASALTGRASASAQPSRLAGLSGGFTAFHGAAAADDFIGRLRLVRLPSRSASSERLLLGVVPSPLTPHAGYLLTPRFGDLHESRAQLPSTRSAAPARSRSRSRRRRHLPTARTALRATSCCVELEVICPRPTLHADGELDGKRVCLGQHGDPVLDYIDTRCVMQHLPHAC